MYVAVLPGPATSCSEHGSASAPTYISSGMIAEYLKLNCHNVLEAFRELWFPISRSKASESRMRENRPLLRIEIGPCKRSDRVVMFAKSDWRCKMHASDGDVEISG